MPGSKSQKSRRKLAYRRRFDFLTRRDRSIKVGCQSNDMRLSSRIVGVRSTEQSCWHPAQGHRKNINNRTKKCSISFPGNPAKWRRTEYRLIKSGWGDRPCEARQPARERKVPNPAGNREIRVQRSELSGLSLIHIFPYCFSKCRYCDFYSHPGERGVPEAYVDALLRLSLIHI